LINQDKAIEIFIEALKIYSPSGKEEKMSNFLLKFLKEQGFDNARKDEVGNVIGEIGEGKPILLLSSHMDTVNDYIEVKVDEDKIYARGAVDAKGPLMSLAIAASKFCDKKINGKLIFAGIVKEEVSVEGINQFLEDLKHDGIDVNFAIFAEPNNTKNIVVAYKGRSLLKITIRSNKGPGHPAISWLFDNSIELGYSFYLKLKELCESKYKGRTPYFSTIPNITEISSSGGKNVIPPITILYIDLRYPKGRNSDELFKDIKELGESFGSENDCIADIEILSRVEPYSISPKNEFIKILSEAIEEIFGEGNYKLTRKTGSTFMNVIGNKLKIPTVSIGPGDPTLEHTDKEYILKKDFLDAISIVEKFIEKLFRTENTG
jgi:LysW-gamma-L-lysine carboxypeptidase